MIAFFKFHRLKLNLHGVFLLAYCAARFSFLLFSQLCITVLAALSLAFPRLWSSVLVLALLVIGASQLLAKIVAGLVDFSKKIFLAVRTVCPSVLL
jgi:hypothetical protein